jgi:hypothetical protein
MVALLIVNMKAVVNGILEPMALNQDPHLQIWEPQCRDLAICFLQDRSLSLHTLQID